MTDLDDLFSSIVDESATRRAPVDLVETRAREHRRRRRRRHHVRGFVAGAVAIALVASGIAFGRSDGAPGPRSDAPPTPNRSVRVPTGWKTYDYGLARLSIPPGWTASSGCPATYAPHNLTLADPRTVTASCDEGGDGPAIAIEPWKPPRDSVHQPFVPNGSVNGIPYDLAYPRCFVATVCGPFVRIKALRVAITFRGDVDTTAVLQTLTYSTYARILQQPFGPAPTSWKTITFDGYSVRVPRSWQTFPADPLCRPSANTAYYSNIESTALGCPFTSTARPPQDSLQLFGRTTQPVTAVGSRNGLKFGRLAVEGPVVDTVAFTVTGGARPLVVTIGLGLDAAVARGILGSLRRAGS